MNENANKKGTRCLIYDIETSPNLAFVWGKWQQDVIAYEEEWYILCFAYKWLGEKTTHVVALPDFDEYKKAKDNDIMVVAKLHELFNEADIIIAHNGNNFDQKKVHARFAYHNMLPPSPYKQIDTKLVAKRYFNFNSNKLDDLGDHLKIGRKIQTGGFDLWLGCMNGDMKAWRKMKKYNKQDVDLLEKIYLRFRPWISNHPSLYHKENADMCPSCGVAGRMQRRGYARNKTTIYKRYQCQNCGSWNRERVQEKDQGKPKYVST
jgi:hypothetical protein